MNLVPPLAMRTYTLTPEQLADAEAGYCTQCPKPIEGRRAKRLVERHADAGMRFLQCTRCKVVVVLEA